MPTSKMLEGRLNKITKGQWMLIVLLCIVVFGIVGSSIDSNSYRESPALTLQPQAQRDWQSNVDQFGKEYRDAKGNDVKQEQIGDLARLRLEPAMSIVDWIGTVKKIEEGIIKTDVAELHPNNTSALGSINIGSVVKFSGTLEVKGLPYVWKRYWAPEPVVNDCSYSVVAPDTK